MFDEGCIISCKIYTGNADGKRSYSRVSVCVHVNVTATLVGSGGTLGARSVLSSANMSRMPGWVFGLRPVRVLPQQLNT